MKPIATYHERMISVSRLFELYPDRVEVHAKWLFRGKYANKVKLETLKPEYRKFQIRHRWFRYAKWMIAMGALLAAFLVYRAQGWAIRPGGVFPAEAWVALGISGIGVALVAITRRHIQFVRFDPVNKRGGLDIGRSGPDQEGFGEFIEKVKRQIRKQRPRERE